MGLDSNSNSLLAIRGSDPEDDIKCPHCYWFKFLERIKKSEMESQIIQLFKACSEFDFRGTTKTLRKRPHSIA